MHVRGLGSFINVFIFLIFFLNTFLIPRDKTIAIEEFFFFF